MQEFDVIIIGAGPAGLIAAERTAKAGLKVLLLDKKQEIGVPKRCAEGLSMHGFELAGLKPDKSWAVQPVYGAVLYAPSGKKVEIRFDEISGYILERRVFEKFLAQNAVEAGAVLKVKSNAQGFERKNGKVIVTVKEIDCTKEYSAPLIIACDGVESKVARKLGLNTLIKLIDIDSGFQYEMSGIDMPDDKMLLLYFGTDIAPRGYCWIFPKGKHRANVGIGIAGNSEKTAKYYLDKFVESQPGLKKGSIVEVNVGCVPVGGMLEKMTADNLIVAGDAAHHVNPIHGGGIAFAMEGGILAAETAVKAVKAKNFSDAFLGKYNKKWWKQRGNKMLKILKMRHMMENLTNGDFETLAANISGEDILKIAEGNLIQSARIVTKKLVKSPGLVKVMLKYLK